MKKRSRIPQGAVLIPQPVSRGSITLLFMRETFVISQKHIAISIAVDPPTFWHKHQAKDLKQLVGWDVHQSEVNWRKLSILRLLCGGDVIIFQLTEEPVFQSDLKGLYLSPPSMSPSLGRP